MPVSLIKNRLNFVLSVFFVTCAFLPLSEASLTPIEISEEKREIPTAGSWFSNLSEYRDHLIEEHGTKFAFLLNYTQQMVAKSSHDQGKSRGVGYFNLEIEQKLWPGAFWRKKQKPINNIDKVNIPVCYIHGEKDWIVKLWHSQVLLDKTNTDKKLVIIKNGAHAEYLMKDSRSEFVKEMPDWFNSTL